MDLRCTIATRRADNLRTVLSIDDLFVGDDSHLPLVGIRAASHLELLLGRNPTY